ncbi:MAG TPA: DMT family transporter [Tepidisphaeraceae bacterium]|nr:DMT family transporter [Tepidisphaeraceae bacterium]
MSSAIPPSSGPPRGKAPRKAISPQEAAARRSAVAAPPPPPAPVQPVPEVPDNKPMSRLASWTQEWTPGQIVWFWTLGLLYALSLLILIPWQWQPFPESDVDSSWVMGLHWAWVHKIDFAHDFIFAYGPWGFVLRGSIPETFHLTIFAWWFFSTAMFAGLYRVSRRLTRHRWVRGVWIMLMILMVAAAKSFPETRILALGWAIAVLYFYVDGPAITIAMVLLATALALGSLTKFTIALGAISVLIPISIEEIRHKRPPWLGAIYVVALMMFWLAAGQSFGAIFPYFRHSWAIAGEFSRSDGLVTPSETRDVLLFLLCAGLVLIGMGLLHWRVPKVGHAHPGNRPHQIQRGVLALICILAVCFLAFKSGYTRHDVHEIIATTSLGIFSMLLVAGIWHAVNRTARVVAVAVVLVCLLLQWSSMSRFANAGLPGSMAQSAGALPRNTLSALQWLGGANALDDQYQEYLQTVISRKPLARVTGSVDFYPYAMRPILANGLDYQPRPVFQSYMAPSAQFINLNAEFLRGPHAPQNILFELTNIDTHYPSLEESASWPEIFSLYDLKDARKSVLLYERSPQPRKYSKELIAVGPVGMDDWVDVPETDDPIWLKIDLKETRRGALLAGLYKHPIVHLNARLKDGSTIQSRLLPDVARDGFLISPLAGDMLHLALIAHNNWHPMLNNSIVKQIQVTIDPGIGSSSAFEPQYSLSFARLVMPHSNILEVPGIGRQVRFWTWVNMIDRNTGTGRPSMQLNESRQPVLSAPALTQIVIPVPTDAKTVRLEFGMFENSYQNGNETDGVEFKVFGVKEIEAGRVNADTLFARRLNPLVEESDRGEQEITIKLPSPPPPRLLLETGPGLRKIAPYSYWSDIEFGN